MVNLREQTQPAIHQSGAQGFFDPIAIQGYVYSLW